MADLMDELVRAAGKVSGQVEKGVDSAKLRWAILRVESQLDSVYTRLGRYISDQRDNLADEACLSRIAELYREIDRLKQDLVLLKKAVPSRRTCGNCGGALRKSDVFCPKCGEKSVF